MLSPILFLWNAGYPLYTYGSVFVIMLIIWKMKRNQQGLSLGPSRSCYRCHRKIGPRTGARSSTARRTSQEEAEKLRKLLSLMRSHNWLPREGSVRSILCADPCCPTCNDLALEIQQLLQGESHLVTSTSLGQAQHSSGPENLSEPGVSEPRLHLGAKHSKKHASASATKLSQVAVQQPSAQMAAPLSDEFSIQHYWDEYLQLGQDCPLPGLSGTLDTLHAPSLVEPGSPATQPEKKNNSAAILEKKEAPEAGLRSKMKCLLHWLNPRMGSQRQEQGAVLSKSATVTKAKQSTAEKSPDLSDSRVGDAKSRKAGEPKARPPPAEDSSLPFFDASSCPADQRQGSALQFCQSLIVCHHHQCPEHSDPLNCDVQADSRPGISTPGLEDACPKEKARPERKQCMDSQSWATPR